jgi:hypothetical protein
MAVNAFAPEEDNINQYNALAQTTGPTQEGQAYAQASPFSISPWDGGFNDPLMDAGGANSLLDPIGGAGRMFDNVFGHKDLTNPFFNRFANQLAPGLSTIFSLMNSGASERPGNEFTDFMANYAKGLSSGPLGSSFGRGDLQGFMKQILSGQAGDEYFAGGLQMGTDRDIMAALGDVIQTAGYTGLTPLAQKGLQNMLQQMLMDWRSAAIQIPAEMSGNAFINFVHGSGWLDKLEISG